MDLERKAQLVQGSRLLDSFGIFDEQGHLSARTAPGAESFWINEFSSPGTASVQEYVEVELGSDDYPESAPLETVFHTAIYRARDDVNAICHNHSPYVIHVTGAGLKLRPVHHIGVVQPGPVTVYEEYDQEGGMLITTDAEGKRVADALGDDRALVFRGHGATLVGETVVEATMAAIKLEYGARMLYHQALLGEPWYLPEAFVEEMAPLMFTESVLEKSFDYYLTRME